MIPNEGSHIWIRSFEQGFIESSVGVVQQEFAFVGIKVIGITWLIIVGKMEGRCSTYFVDNWIKLGLPKEGRN